MCLEKKKEAPGIQTSMPSTLCIEYHGKTAFKNGKVRILTWVTSTNGKIC